MIISFSFSFFIDFRKTQPSLAHSEAAVASEPPQ